MGHAYSSIVADFFARFKKIDGFDVYFLTGTDEHGLKIQRSAEKAKMEPKSFCDNISKTFLDLTKTLNLSNNDFIRTTERRHAISVKNLWTILKENDILFVRGTLENFIRMKEVESVTLLTDDVVSFFEVASFETMATNGCFDNVDVGRSRAGARQDRYLGYR